MSAISTPQNFVQLLSNRELGARVPLSDQGLMQNIKEGNYTKTILHAHKEAIRGFDVRGDLVATVGDTVKLWNLKMGKCLWTFVPSQKVEWRENIKIVDNNIICSSSGESLNEDNGAIRIIDLQTGIEKAAISNHQLEVSKICIIGRRIFCVLKDGAIKEWDLNGKFVQSISEDFSPLTLIDGLGNFLVQVNHDIIIHDVEEKTKRRVELSIAGQRIRQISSIHIESHRLFCECLTEEKSLYVFVINLKNGAIIDQYRGAETFTVRSIIADKEWVYFGGMTGAVVAVNLPEKRHVVLDKGKPKFSVHQVVLERRVLISQGVSWSLNTELKFWDIRSMKEITTMQLQNVGKISFVAGKLLTVIGRSLVQWDYLVAHKGERIVENNEPVLESRVSLSSLLDDDDDECCLQ